MSVKKKRSARRKLIDVRRFDLRVSVHAPDPIVLVVDRDEQDVRFLQSHRSNCSSIPNQ
jgi:hypothetical protein